jgi:hypothetical protein
MAGSGIVPDEEGSGIMRSANAIPVPAQANRHFPLWETITPCAAEAWHFQSYWLNYENSDQVPERRRSGRLGSVVADWNPRARAPDPVPDARMHLSTLLKRLLQRKGELPNIPHAGSPSEGERERAGVRVRSSDLAQ